MNLDDMQDAVTDTVLASIFKSQPYLRKLSIRNCNRITDDGLIGFGNKPCSIDNLCRLAELDLSGCLNLTDHVLAKALNLPELRSLSLRNCHKLTIKGFEHMVKNCPSLEFLELSSYIIIDDKVLYIILNSLKRLRKLQISDCDNLQETAIDRIKDIFDKVNKNIPNIIFTSPCLLHLQK